MHGTAHVAQRRRAVGANARVIERARVLAIPGETARARRARTARVEAQHHVVAHHEAVDAGAHLDDHPGAFVTEHDRVRQRNDAVDGRQVGVTDADADQPHEHFTRARRGDLDLAQ